MTPLTSKAPFLNGIANIIELPDGRTATVTGGSATMYNYLSSDGFTCTASRFADPQTLAVKLSNMPDTYPYPPTAPRHTRL